MAMRPKGRELPPQPLPRMTRGGSVAFYLVAVVVGCLFITAGLVVLRPGLGPSLLLIYLLSIAYGGSSVVVFAFLLRRITAAFGWNLLWQWLGTGAALAWILVWGGHFVVLGLIRLMQVSPQLGDFLFKIVATPLTGGPLFAVVLGLGWISILVGAATASVLYRVHHVLRPRLNSTSRSGVLTD